jgi:hypothetical protein
LGIKRKVNEGEKGKDEMVRREIELYNEERIGNG